MPLIKSPSKKALKHNIEVEMESHPSKKKHNQNLAIAFSVQRNARKKKYANGGQVGLDASKKEKYAEDDFAPSIDPGATGNYSSPAMAEYMDDKMPAFAEGGPVPCMHCGGMGYSEGGKVELDDETDPFDHGEGISDYQEEGPGTRVKNNINSRDYNAGDDSQLSKQPRDSNEHGDSRESDSENENDSGIVSKIRKKEKAKRG